MTTALGILSVVLQARVLTGYCTCSLTKLFQNRLVSELVLVWLAEASNTSKATSSYLYEVCGVASFHTAPHLGLSPQTYCFKRF